MKNIFEKLYYGEFRPFERKIIRTPNNQALNKKIREEERYFIEKMSVDDSARFKQLQNLYMQSNAYDQEDSFIYGFKLATMLMSAIFSDDK